jgi:hypothetical protein
VGVDRDAAAALERLGLTPPYGEVTVYRATDCAEAAQIEEDRRIYGDENRQAWVASSADIAPLHDGTYGGIEAEVQMTVLACDLFWECAREGENGDVELFYLLDCGSGCAVNHVQINPYP